MSEPVWCIMLFKLFTQRDEMWKLGKAETLRWRGVRDNERQRRKWEWGERCWFMWGHLYKEEARVRILPVKVCCLLSQCPTTQINTTVDREKQHDLRAVSGYYSELESNKRLNGHRGIKYLSGANVLANKNLLTTYCLLKGWNSVTPIFCINHVVTF